ncbi:hypothetical protein F0562_028084 [Nyssa sinensis]|uniref:Uncharacterized protein n=1 Tax=Nyssa sinensis TaxID=561372 RepID=A0A5J5B745_9ASTE|nr:hypothetical protein F0562_028084 [Nyssa sinensis]
MGEVGARGKSTPTVHHGKIHLHLTVILRWDSTASEEARERMIFEGDSHEIDRYLQAVNEIQRPMESATIAEEHNKANSAIQIAMARLEDEFRK